MTGKKSMRKEIFEVGDKVWVQNEKSSLWDTPAVVAKVRSHRQSYYVEAEEGGLYLCNCKFLKPRKTESGEKECAKASTSTDIPPAPRRSSHHAPTGKERKRVISFGETTMHIYQQYQGHVLDDVWKQENQQ
jgi:hypothetical protein